jgi:recombination protein RecA
MPSAAILRQQIEAALAHRIPSALSPAPRVIRPTARTGVSPLDLALSGGLPLGALTELAGPECSGRTSLALSFVAGLTRLGQVSAWVDVSDTLHPESAAAAGIDLTRLLWIRCGTDAEQLPLPGFAENTPELCAQRSDAPAVGIAASRPMPIRVDPRCAEPQPAIRKKNREAVPVTKLQTLTSSSSAWAVKRPRAAREYSRLDQALRATDLLLNAGGFAAIVLDMGSIAPEFALRVPLATWFRYRAAAERTQASVLLLTQQACTKSSAGLLLHCAPGPIASDSTTVLTGAEYQVVIARERFAPTGSVTEFTRKPPQRDYSGAGAGFGSKGAHPSERAPLSFGGFTQAIRWQTQIPWSAPHPAEPAKAGRP